MLQKVRPNCKIIGKCLVSLCGEKVVNTKILMQEESVSWILHNLKKICINILSFYENKMNNFHSITSNWEKCELWLHPLLILKTDTLHRGSSLLDASLLQKLKIFSVTSVLTDAKLWSLKVKIWDFLLQPHDAFYSCWSHDPPERTRRCLAS